MRKASKGDVDYSRGHRDSHCGQAFEDDKGYCRYFIEPLSRSAGDLGQCEKVSGPDQPRVLVPVVREGAGQIKVMKPEIWVF